MNEASNLQPMVTYQLTQHRAKYTDKELILLHQFEESLSHPNAIILSIVRTHTVTFAGILDMAERYDSIKNNKIKRKPVVAH